jgi:hypothetical protein
MDCSSCLFSAAKKQIALPTAPRAYSEEDPEKAKRQGFELWSLLGLRATDSRQPANAVTRERRKKTIAFESTSCKDFA